MVKKPYMSPQQRMRKSRGKMGENSREANVRSDTPEGKEALNDLAMNLALAPLGGPMLGLGVKAVTRAGKTLYEYANRLFSTKKAAMSAAKAKPPAKVTAPATAPAKVTPKPEAKVTPKAPGKALVPFNPGTALVPFKKTMSPAAKAAAAAAAVAASTGLGYGLSESGGSEKRPSGSSRPSSAPPERRPRLNSPPAPVEKGKPGMTRAEAEEAGLTKSANPSGKKDPYPDGVFRKLFPNAEIEYDYPSDDDQAVDMKKGGRVKKAASKGKRGSVSAEEFKDSYANWQNNKDKLAMEKSPRKKPVKKNMGGMMKYANGGKVRGAGMARGGRPCKMVSMKGS